MTKKQVSALIKECWLEKKNINEGLVITLGEEFTRYDDGWNDCLDRLKANLESRGITI